jgi:dolichyl-phosphate-mannose-protein mannosyltransferase
MRNQFSDGRQFVFTLNHVICFSILSGVIFDYLTQHFPRWIRHIVYGSTLAITIYSFKLFSPLAYGYADGSSEKNSTMFGLRWLESWEF